MGVYLYLSEMCHKMLLGWALFALYNSFSLLGKSASKVEEMRTISAHGGKNSSLLLSKYDCVISVLLWKMNHCTGTLYATTASLSQWSLNKAQIGDEHWCNLSWCWGSHCSIMATVACCYDNIRLPGVMSENELWKMWMQFSLLKEQKQQITLL